MKHQDATSKLMVRVRFPSSPLNRCDPVPRTRRDRRPPCPEARRRITIEYTLIAGVNDDLAQARKLARLLRGLPVKVNLIPLNPHDGTDLVPPSPERCHEFQEELAQAGLSVFTRRRRGDEIAAACGQLALRGARPRRGAMRVLP